jgi:iron complex transport system substrate-binding protein
LAWPEVLAWGPEVLVVACCGFGIPQSLQDVPRLRSYPGWADLPCARNGRVYVVDGSAYFNRPGPRLVDSLVILAQALHPEVHPLPAGLPAAVRVHAP